MEKIIESTLNDLIRRIEILESHTNHTNKINNISGTASEDQRKYIKGLGGIIPDDLSKEEAGIMIDQLKPSKLFGKKLKELQEGDGFI